MRRKVRTYPFARLRIADLTRIALCKLQLPVHLQLAHAILESELKLFYILDETLKYASACAQKINNRDLSLSKTNSRGKVHASFSRLAKCITRAPVSLRNELDDRICGIIDIPDIIDSTVIEEIIDASYDTFARSKSEPAQAALRAFVVSDAPPERLEKKGKKSERGRKNKNKGRKNEKIIGLKVEYEALDFATRRKCEEALKVLPRDNSVRTAATIFEALTAALDVIPASKISREASDLIIDYVAKVGTLWKNNRLSPSRANHPDNPKYRSKFHRFVELVLTAVTEPQSNRHTADLDKISQQISNNHALLPPELKNKIGKGPRRADREWLVSEDHVRKALASTTLKTGHDTP